MSIPGFTASTSLRCSGEQYSRTRQAGANSAVVRPQLPIGEGGSSSDCVSRYQDCYVDCSVRYPDDPNSLNAQLRQGCFDACDAAYRLCSPTLAIRAIGRGIGRIARVAAPIVG